MLFAFHGPSLALELFLPPVQDSQGLNPSEGCLLWCHSRELRDAPLTQAVRRSGGWEARGHSSQASRFTSCMLVCTWKVLEPGDGITSGVILTDSLLAPVKNAEMMGAGSWEGGLATSTSPTEFRFKGQ